MPRRRELQPSSSLEAGSATATAGGPARLRDGVVAAADVLVVLLCPLGDTLFATPALRALRRRFPRARITALCWTSNEPLLRYNPHVDQVVACPGAWDLAVSTVRMLDRRFDVGVGLSHFGSWVTPFFRARVRVGFHGLGLTRLRSGAPRRRLRRRLRRPGNGWAVPLEWRWAAAARRRWGWAAAPGGRASGLASWFFGRGRDRELHAVEYCLEVVARLGCVPCGLEMELVTGPDERRRAAALLEGFTGPGPVVAFHPGADHFPAKRWPAERFARLADELAERYGARIVLVGGPGDVALAEAVGRQVRRAAVLNLAGRLALLETAAVLERADLMVGNDSGPLHMAAAVGTPVVALFGPSEPRHFAPLGAHHRVLVGTCRRGRRCVRWLNGPLAYLQAAECRCGAMATISVEAVAATAGELLQNRRAATGGGGRDAGAGGAGTGAAGAGAGGRQDGPVASSESPEGGALAAAGGERSGSGCHGPELLHDAEPRDPERCGPEPRGPERDDPDLAPRVLPGAGVPGPEAGDEGGTGP